jgi:hypothetical protein
MRIVVAATAALVVLSCAARGEDDACRSYPSAEPHAIEWVEHGEQRGARIVVRDPHWELGNSRPYATSKAVCETCSNGQVAGAVLWFGAFDTSNRDLEREVAPEWVANMMAPPPFQMFGAELHADTESVPVAIDGLEGRARAIGVKFFGDSPRHVIALSATKGRCLTLYGVLYAKEAAEIAIDRLASFVSVIRVESYTPTPDPRVIAHPPARPPLEGFPLGDAFRRRYIDQQ